MFWYFWQGQLSISESIAMSKFFFKAAKKASFPIFCVPDENVPHFSTKTHRSQTQSAAGAGHLLGLCRYKHVECFQSRKYRFLMWVSWYVCVLTTIVIQQSYSYSHTETTKEENRTCTVPNKAKNTSKWWSTIHANCVHLLVHNHWKSWPTMVIHYISVLGTRDCENWFTRLYKNKSNLMVKPKTLQSPA